MADQKKDTIDVKILAYTAMMVCLTALLGLTPAGTIPLPIVEITIAHVPAIITAISIGFIPSLVVGLALGLISLLRAVAMPMTPLDPFFINPLVSMLPRILIPVVTYLAFAGFKKLLSKSKAGFAAPAAIASALGSAANTVFVLLAMYVIYFKDLSDMAGELGTTVEAVFIGIASLNGICEMIAAALISTLVAVALKRAKLIVKK